MSFITNSSPYGSNNMGTPQQQQGPRNKGVGEGGFLSNWVSPAYSLYNNRNNGGISQSIYQGLFGKPEQNYQQSTLGPEQQALYQQLQAAGQAPGAGGAFGESADYYRDLLSNDSQDINAMFAPEMRRFNEQIVPDLAHQFASQGYGGLSSSGFRNAAVSAGTDLSERLGSMRAQVRQRGAEGLRSIGSEGLQNFNENIHRPETYGLVGNFAEGVGKATGAYATGKLG